MRKHFIRILMLLLVVLWSACGRLSSPSGSESADSLVVDTLSPAYMIQQYTDEISLQPQNPELYYLRALAYYHNGQTQEAMADLDMALKIKPRGAEYLHLKGYLFFVSNQDDSAAFWFRKSVDAGSKNPETYYQIGQIHYLHKEFKDAEKWFQDAIRMDSLDPQYDLAIGLIYEEQKNFKRAEQWYLSSINKDSTFIKGLTQLHDLCMNQLGDQKRAQEYNNQILTIDSLHPMAHYNEGNRFVGLAERITDKSKEQEYTALMQLAISEFSTALLVSPRFANAYYNRGYCSFYLGELDHAMADFDSCLKYDPYNERAWFMEGSIYEYYDDFASALDAYSRAAALRPGFKDAQDAVSAMKLKVGGK